MNATTIVKPVAAFEADGQLFRTEIEAINHAAARIVRDAFVAAGATPDPVTIAAVAKHHGAFLGALHPLMPHHGRKSTTTAAVRTPVPLAEPTPQRLRADAAKVFASAKTEVLTSRELMTGLSRLNSDSPWHARWDQAKAHAALCDMANLFRQVGIRRRQQRVRDRMESVYCRADVAG